jgi:thiamine biosynthesis protein ThiI
MNQSGKRCAVVHYAEVGLKGGNRGIFENQLRRNIARALSDTTLGSVRRSFGRLVIFFPKERLDWPTVENRLKNIFGIANFSPAVITDHDIESITQAALSQTENLDFKSFKVETKRAQKEYYLKSQQVNEQVGAAIQKQTGAAVNLSSPEITCYVEIFNKNALVFTEKIEGLGGLPVGVNETAVSLLSSGIDSPVASWKIMKRGVRVIFVHFHSIPATSQASANNAKRLVQTLTRFQYKTKLYLVPFLPVQQEILTGSPSRFRVLLYRRSMIRLAEKIAQTERANALITGENVGQVASQTLSNIRAIGEAATLPVLRPLAGDDKSEITQTAIKIGTFDISIEPYEDCCSLYVPRHPVTKANPADLVAIENELDLEVLYQSALKNAESVEFRYP